jgi:hypothetical protein
MSNILVNTIKDTGNNTLLSSDGSGNIAGSLLSMTPAFEATISSQQTVTDATTTKAQFNQETYDVGSCYDHTTNYRFTPNVTGKYYVYVQLGFNTDGSSQQENMNVYIFKNGASIQTSHFNFSANPIWYSTGVISSVVVLNGSTDYVEAYGNCDDNSGNPGFQASPYSRFGAYRIIGA